MKLHSCKICHSPHRQAIEDWRFKDGLKLEEILARAKTELGFKLAIGTLSNHLSYVGSEMAQIIEDQMREVVRDKGQLAANVPVLNIELTSKLIQRIVHIDSEGNPALIPLADDFLIDLLKERRQSAQLILAHTPSDPANKAGAAFTEVARRILERSEGE
jgi:hypothetical protein